ncbi:hypothetical protein E2C01_090420 [Portunus trituberculatus]|uniref:Uncharacterized protein n=1 Tax=Portunus trituberculatus TaxID=210409 RepID=A0A5B7JK74_PORTR|nr:hypothetical protein [Portunus trituberculatus]
MEHFLLQCHASTLNILHYAPGSPSWPSQHLTCPPSWWPQASPILATCCPSPYLCLLEEDRPATTPVIPTQDYPRAYKDPKEATKIYGFL